MKPSGYKIETECRSCKHNTLNHVLSLGTPPLADRLLTEKQLSEKELFVPLTLAWCPHCSLLQIRETVDPAILFKDNYPYYSSISSSYLGHAQRYAEDILNYRPLDSSSLVMEIACNDGYLLTNFMKHGIPVLGIDPAEGPAIAARNKNIPVLIEFFDTVLAGKLAGNYQYADVLIANNVLAHVPDPNELVRGASMVLKQDGLMVIEVPWVVDLLDKNAFDTIYHQHFCYFSLTALDSLFRQHGLYINDARQYDVQGGSIRLFIEKHDNQSSEAERLLKLEQVKNLTEPAPYRAFAERTESVRTELKQLLVSLKNKGCRIAGYGAAAKASTLLHYCGIGKDVLTWVVDKNPIKHGKYMGEIHLPIYPVEKLQRERPDYALLLSWNLADEIIDQQKSYRSKGGRFIIPIPVPEIV